MRYSFADLQLDTVKRTVQRGAHVIALPDLSFDMLVKLLESAPKTVTFDDLRRDVWRAEHVSAETIAQRVALLRKALRETGGGQDYIRTVRGSGYAMIGPLAVVGEEPLKQTGAWRRHLAVAGFASAAVVLGLALYLPANLLQNQPETQSSESVSAGQQKSTATMLVERARDQLSLHQLRETDKAIDLLRQALTQEPGHFDARMALGAALTTKTTKFGGGEALEKEAEAIARSLISEQPNNSNAWSLLAYALGSQGRLDESSSAYEYAYQLDPKNLIAMSSAAHNLLVRGELYQAYQLEKRARQAGGNNKYAEIQVAQILELIGNKDAVIWRERALALNPGQTVVLSEVARSYLRQGKPDEAIRVLDQAEGADQMAPHILQLRGRAALALGNKDDALSSLVAAGEAGHKDLLALRLWLEEDSEALAFLENTDPVKMAGDVWPGSHVQMAEIAAAADREKDAVQYLVQAVSLGWRDIAWLEQSPFLTDVMASPAGQELVARIQRELALQRQLIERML